MELKIIFEPVAIKAATIKLQFIIGKFIAKNLLPKHSEMNAELMVGQVPKERPVRKECAQDAAAVKKRSLAEKTSV